jgi:hypothetical protein
MIVSISRIVITTTLIDLVIFAWIAIQVYSMSHGHVHIVA